MNFFDAVVLGIIEGFTEFLPISSTAHLILTSKIISLSQNDFLKSFEIAIQLGAISSVISLYGKKFLTDCQLNKKIVAAFLPTIFFGFIFYKIIKNYLFESISLILASLFLGGIFLIVFEMFYREKPNAENNISRLSYKKAFLIGCFQSMAMVPGISRSAATIIGGLLTGLKREAIVEFSFLLAVPTMLAATGFDLLHNAASFSLKQLHLLFLGMVASFIVARIAISFFLKFIKTHNFTYFGVYRVLIAFLFWLIFF